MGKKRPDYNALLLTIPGSGGKPVYTEIPPFPMQVDQEGDVTEKVGPAPRDLSEETFAKYASSFFGQSIMKTLTNKGTQYSGDTPNALVNFLDGSKVINITPQSYLLAMATKHWLSLGLWASGKSKQNNDQIVERCKDVIIYMLLLVWMVDTDQTGK